MNPHERPPDRPLRRKELPEVIKKGGNVFFNGKQVSAYRIGNSVMILTRYCGCESCDACLIALTFMS